MSGGRGAAVRRAAPCPEGAGSRGREGRARREAVPLSAAAAAALAATVPSAQCSWGAGLGRAWGLPVDQVRGRSASRSRVLEPRQERRLCLAARGRSAADLPFGIFPALPPLHGENSPTPFPVVTREPQLPPELRMELAKWKVVRSHSLVTGPLLPVSTTSCPQTLGFDEGNETHPPGVSTHPHLPVRGRKSGPKLGEISSILGW